MIVAFTNQKGGVGKTTSAINLGAGIALLGHTVLLVDFDPQANLTSGLNLSQSSPTIYDTLYSAEEASACIKETNVKNLFLLPADNSLSGAAVELVSQKNRHLFLKNALENIQDDYDFIFIDCPPSIGLLTVNALTASDAIIIPLQCEYFAMEGVAQIIKNYQLVKKTYNKDLTIMGIILTMYDSRTNLSQEVATEIVKAFGKNVFNTIIPRNIKISESPSHGLSVIEYDKNCLGAKSYIELAEEVVKKWRRM